MAEIKRGLRDVVLTETHLSMIDGNAGKLVIAGFPLEEIASVAAHEEMLYLLWYDSLPNQQELDNFSQTLVQNRMLPETTLHVLRAAAQSKLHPMDALRMGVDTLALAISDVDNLAREACLQRAPRLVARFPVIVAAYWRLLHGQEPIAPNPELSHAANFLYMLNGEEATPAAVRGLNTYLNTVIDHGMNNSTFTARSIASTRSDMISAIVGAIGSLKGPLHGGAPGPAIDMVFEIRNTAASSGKSVEDVSRAWVKARLAAHERLMGFGHRVYRVRDPRADVLGAAARKLYEGTGNVALYNDAQTVERVILQELEADKPGRSIKTNVEFYTALVLHGIGLESPIFSSLFAIARTGGWIAHILEQYAEDELIRPTTTYSGEYERRWVVIGER